MKLYNTLSKSIEDFKPIADPVTFYACGPTVYDYAHIGNLRTFIFEDILRRALEFSGFKVKEVMNITDVDDKTIKKSAGKKVDFERLTRDFEAKFFVDLEKLNIEKPEVSPRATDYIPQIVDFIEDLIAKGFAYKTSDGSVYFSIAKFPDYGNLAGLDQSGLQAGIRVNNDEYDKENPADFALWKAWSEDDGEIFWQTSLGKGRPGWSIECSVMSTENLGQTLDIHAGGVDLIFPHHTNEIAQSEAKTGKKFVNFWLHAEHLLVENKKMSKSLNNFYTLSDLVQKGFSPLDFRYLCLTAHYRDKLNFTFDALSSTKNSLDRARKILSKSDKIGAKNQVYCDQFQQAIENDLNTPQALAVFWTMLRDQMLSDDEKRATAFYMDKIFALDLDQNLEIEISDEVKKLVSERETARKDKNFELSDKLRDQIFELGFLVEDTKEGSKISGRN